jgi:hypothetical protein
MRLPCGLRRRDPRRLVGRWNLVGRGFASRAFGLSVLQALQRRAVGRLRRARGHRSRSHALAEPERVEQPVEPVPVGFPRREQMLERERNRPGLFGIARRHQGGGVAAFMQADGKGIVAQGLEKRCEFGRDQARDLVDFLIVRAGAAAAHATFPSRRSVTSRVTRDLSSWVLSRHIRVSCTISGDSAGRARRARPAPPPNPASRRRRAPCAILPCGCFRPCARSAAPATPRRPRSAP